MTRSIFSLCLILIAYSGYSQTNSTNKAKNDTALLKTYDSEKNELNSVDLNNFIGKTVQELLENKVLGSYKTYYFLDVPRFKLQSLILQYPKGFSLEITVSCLQYQPEISMQRNWDFAIFKKEKISTLNLLKYALY